MNREEFLRQLEASLTGRVSEQVVQENISYYGNYIEEQVRGGKSEAEVLGSLGDPRLIAKTIEGSSRFASGAETVEGGFGGAYSGTYRDDAQEEYEAARNHSFRQVSLPGWLVGCIVIALVMIVLMLVFRVFAFFAPFILVLIAVSVIVRIVRSWFGGE
ncbi:MAG: DUF1700 domain-containing protein [Roseburia sp.]|nr:DUF1700 domain-containing protein [Roseburia sp.]